MTSKAVWLFIDNSVINKSMKKEDCIPTYRIQLVHDGHIKAQSISKPEEIVKSLESLARSDREVLVGLYLDARNQVIGHHIISMGSVSKSVAHPREVFKPAIIRNASSVLVAHNHPSNNVYPSQADIDVTKRLINAGMILGIYLEAVSLTNCGCLSNVPRGRDFVENLKRLLQLYLVE